MDMINKKELSTNEIMSLMSECPLPAVNDDACYDTPRRPELSMEEIERRATLAFMKAEAEGVGSLDSEERE